jgi:phage terminase large subunit-like protein
VWSASTSSSSRPTDAFGIAADVLDPPARGPDWRAKARPDQLPPPQEWSTLFLSGGRGSGKTWAGGHIFRELIENDPAHALEGPGEWAVVAPTFGDARDKCIESSESGLLKAFGTTVAEVEAGRSEAVAKWNRSIGELYLRDGTAIQIDGADDGAYRVQGLNLRGAWCDEVGLWKKWHTAWRESIGFALRKGQSRRVATGTPKRDLPARQLVRELIADPKVISRRLLTADNWANLSETFRSEIAPYMGTELGRQELEGILLEEAEGALWQREWIERGRVAHGPAKGYRVMALGLDPSDGNANGAEQGIALAGLGWDNELYLASSEGRRSSVKQWLTYSITEAKENRAIIVVEKNHGGKALIELLEQVMVQMGVRVPYREVWASAGKRTRAEPVSVLYEQLPPKVHHIGEHTVLEDQMCNYVPGERSPDRMDAMVWAMSELMTYGFSAVSESEATAEPYVANRNGADGVAVPWR